MSSNACLDRLKPPFADASCGSDSDTSCDSSDEREHVRLLFLDVDGVLNTRTFKAKSGDAYELSLPHLERLSTIVKESQCKIILSTSWRISKDTTAKLWRELERVGIDPIKDTLSESKFKKTQNLSPMPRSAEIISLLSEIIRSGHYKVDSWLALDDNPIDQFGSQRCQQLLTRHFLQTSSKMGITDAHVYSTIQSLTKQGHK